MDLKPLDPQITLKLLEGRADVITPMARARQQMYQDQMCPRCGGCTLKKRADSRTMFRPNDPLPRYLLSCQDCHCLFDPHSGLILSLGNLAQAFEPAIPILKGPED